MFQRQGVPANRAKDAQGRSSEDVRRENRVEERDEHDADVPAHPFVEDLDQETAVLAGSRPSGLVRRVPSWAPVSLSRSTMGMNWT